MENELDFLKNVVRAYQCDKRFSHTLAVAEEAYQLGLIFMPEKAEKLKVAGILHDITKDFKTEKQISLCKQYQIPINENDITPKLLHSKTGGAFAQNLLGEEIVDKEIYDAIFYHTTGRSGMTLFEAIIYLADYIEATRTFEDCVILRKYFYDKIEACNCFNDKLDLLIETMLMSFNMTINCLINENKKIDFETIKARNYFLTDKGIFKSYREV